MSEGGRASDTVAREWFLGDMLLIKAKDRQDEACCSGFHSHSYHTNPAAMDARATKADKQDKIGGEDLKGASASKKSTSSKAKTSQKKNKQAPAGTPAAATGSKGEAPRGRMQLLLKMKRP